MGGLFSSLAQALSSLFGGLRDAKIVIGKNTFSFLIIL